MKGNQVSGLSKKGADRGQQGSQATEAAKPTAQVDHLGLLAYFLPGNTVIKILF